MKERHKRILVGIGGWLTRESWPDGKIDGIHVDDAQDIPAFLDQIIIAVEITIDD